MRGYSKTYGFIIFTCYDGIEYVIEFLVKLFPAMDNKALFHLPPSEMKVMNIPSHFILGFALFEISFFKVI